METGPVLFSQDHVWIDGRNIDRKDAQNHLRIGTNVSFIVKIFENNDYKAVSKEKGPTELTFLLHFIAA